jgi:1-deoxy-D-xylulose-5-phosphate synthase
MKGPKLLHLHTQKGHGYAPAEKDVTIWHAPGKFNVETGERQVKEEPNKPPKFQEVFGETLLELARENPKIVGITPAMPTGCSMNIMMQEMPDRTFDVGIAEGHAVTFSAGMAKDGLQPFCNIYSAFAQRAYDNIIHDVAILNLPVVLCLDRAGLVGEDGPTHHGAFDMAYLRPIPNLTISSPMDEHELRRLMYTAQLPGKGAFVIRYPRGGGVRVDWQCPLEEIKVGTGRRMKEGEEVAVLSIGPIGNNVAKAVQGTKAAHYDMRFLKPLDESILHEVGRKFKKVVVVENGVRNGGLGSAVLEWMSEHDYQPKVVRMGLPDSFVEHGTVAELEKIVGIDVDSIKQEIERSLGE